MIPSNHLRACPEHGVVAPTGRSGSSRCPCCETDTEARPKAVSGESFGQMDLRWQVEPDTMIELLPLLKQNAVDADVYVSVAEIPEEELAAGYTKQEKWFNVAVVEYSSTSRQIIRHDTQAQEAIGKIKSGVGYIERPEYKYDRLDPEEWKAIIAPYISSWEDVEFERDDNILTVTVNTPTDRAYTDLRREMGMVADNADVKIHTVEAGGRWSEGVIRLEVEDG